MATRTPTQFNDINFKVRRVRWTGLLNGDDGTPVEMSGWPDRSVQILGTFGSGGSVTLQGSNDGGTTWAALTDPQGNAITKTSAALEAVTALVHKIRPGGTAGDGSTDLTVWLMMGGRE